MHLDNLKDTVVGNIFRKKIVWLLGLGPKPSRFLIDRPTAINQKPIMSLSDFLLF